MDENDEIQDNEEMDEVESSEEVLGGWTAPVAGNTTVTVETGRGQSVQVPVGSNFIQTVERIANEAHYGGYFRVYLNGSEVVNPVDAPEVVQEGMRIALTSYDKVG